MRLHLSVRGGRVRSNAREILHIEDEPGEFLQVAHGPHQAEVAEVMLFVPATDVCWAFLRSATRQKARSCRGAPV